MGLVWRWYLLRVGGGIMARRTRGSRSKGYTPKQKFEVVLESLRGERSDGEIARAYGVHPVTFSKWKRRVLEKGPGVFAGDEKVSQYERRIAELERMLGQKEVELALLRGFLGGP